MSPILKGVVASGITGRLNTWAPTSAYDALSTVIVPSGGLSSITFAGIPQTGYSHLQIRAIAKTDRADTDDVILMQFNGDTAANYSWHILRGNSSVAASGATANASNISIQYGATGNSGATNIFAGSVVDILDYQNANKNKTTRTLNGMDLNGSGWIYLQSGNWRSTAAINSITLDQQYGSNFAEHSQFALYGVK
jgi:hypothetical protein